MHNKISDAAYLSMSASLRVDNFDANSVLVYPVRKNWAHPQRHHSGSEAVLQDLLLGASCGCLG